MGVSAFIKYHSQDKKEDLIRFLKTVFHTIGGEDGDNEFIHYTKHGSAITGDSPWPYTNFQTIERGSENSTYHYCMCTVNKADPGDKISRKRQRFERLHVLVLDDIGTKAQPNALPPSYIIETSEGNFQWGYVFKEPIKDREIAQKLIHAVYNKPDLTDTGGAMFNKMVKLPIGKNLKEGRDEFEVRLVELNDLQYSVADLVNAWGLNLDARTVSKIKKLGEKVKLQDELLVYLEEHGLLFGMESEDYYKVLCPRGGDHSNGDPYAGYSPLGQGSDPRKRHFKCFHEHDGDVPDTNEFLAVVNIQGGPKCTVDAPNEHFENEDGFHPMSEAIPAEHFPDIRWREDRPPAIKKTHTNVEYLMDRYGYSTYYDVISKKSMVSHYECEESDSDNFDNAMIYSIASQCAQSDFTIGIDMLNGYLQQITLEKPRNPVTEWLDELEPDFDDPRYLAVADKAWLLQNDEPFNPEKFNFEKIDFIKLLSQHLKLEESTPEEMRDLFLHKWMIQNVAAADHGQRTPNKFAKKKWESILTLVGRQGAQKTKFWNALFSAKRIANYFADGVLLNPAEKDSLMNVLANWVVELGELDATFRRSDIAQLKAFLSQGKDRLRPPYGRAVAEYKRRTSFCASVNDTAFLHDSTGNRRFWPVEVTNITMPSEELVLCCWWQAWREYLSGAQWWIDDEATLNNIAVQTEQFDSVHELPEVAKIICTFGHLCFDSMTEGGSNWMTIKEICDASGIEKYNRSTSKMLSSYICNRVPAAKVSSIRKTAHGNVRMYRMPKIKNKFSS